LIKEQWDRPSQQPIAEEDKIKVDEEEDLGDLMSQLKSLGKQ